MLDGSADSDLETRNPWTSLGWGCIRSGKSSAPLLLRPAAVGGWEIVQVDSYRFRQP